MAWPDDDAWIAAARSCAAFHLDVGYAVASYVPGWMLPVDAADDVPIALPDLPQVRGHVLTADTVGREAELIGHFAQLPPLPDPETRRETAAFCSLDVNVLIGFPAHAGGLFAGRAVPVAGACYGRTTANA